MKKKVLFMVINMNIGGTEKALLNMIAEMPSDLFEITVLMLEKTGGFLDAIPSHINVREVESYKSIKDYYNQAPKEVVFDLIRQKHYVKALNIGSYYIVSKFLRKRVLLLSFLLKEQPIIKENYDLAVAYAGPMDLISYFVLEKIMAHKKIQWVHFDVTKNGFNKDNESAMYQKFDKVFVVSDEGRQKLIETIPLIAKNTETFKNIVSTKEILKQAKLGKGFEDSFNGLRILTVGRLTSEKGQDLAIKAAAKLVENGFNIRWYCIGDGTAKGKYEQLIEDYQLQDHFFLLGANPNPYPFIEQCDIYVQPSRHEGYCITLAEAKCLNKPIVTTAFTGANEQIKNGETGFVVELNDHSIYKAVKELVESESYREKFKLNLMNRDEMTNKELQKLYSLG
jgi:glycosyltransferase involved in cell wall biosynthesis